MYELFGCTSFSLAFSFKVDTFVSVFCYLVLCFVCVSSVKVSDTSYPLFSDGVNQGYGDELVQ